MTPHLNPCARCHGSGTEPTLPSAEALRSYMRATGWEPKPPGPAGALWGRPGARWDIAVCDELTPGELEWRSVVQRLGWAEGRSPDEVLDAIRELAAREASRD